VTSRRILDSRLWILDWRKGTTKGGHAHCIQRPPRRSQKLDIRSQNAEVESRGAEGDRLEILTRSTALWPAESDDTTTERAKARASTNRRLRKLAPSLDPSIPLSFDSFPHGCVQSSSESSSQSSLESSIEGLFEGLLHRFFHRSSRCSSHRLPQSSVESSRQSSSESSTQSSLQGLFQGSFGSYAESYPGGIGGCFEEIGGRVLGIGELGHTSEGGGVYTIVYIETRARAPILATGLWLPSVFLLLSTYPVIHHSPSPRTRSPPTASRRAVQTAGSIAGTTTGRTTEPTIGPATGQTVPPEAGRTTRPVVLPLTGPTAVPIARGTAGLAIGRAI